MAFGFVVPLFLCGPKGFDARWRRLLPQLVRVDAHVLPVAEFHAHRPVRPQPRRPHQQRQLLLRSLELSISNIPS